MPITHPTDAALRDFLLGKLPGAESDSVEDHLAGCPECLGRAADEPVRDTLVELLTSAHTRPDQDRSAAATPPPDLLSTPSVGAVTQSYLGPPPGDPTTATPPPELVGHPKYRMLGPLGSGGMGTVWLAEHTVMGRTVALKAVRPVWVARPGSAERFRREVRAAAKLTHENIATAYDAEQIGDRLVLVMEYVPGESLGDVVRRGPLPAVGACRAVRDAARGLAHAHAAGLVHRDVKPGNLIRTPDGTTKVLDFGLVSAAEPGDTDLTGENLVMGTPDYIAPEQAADPRAADARSDIYSLGCTLYHLLAGRAPYAGDTALQKVDAHRDPAVQPEAIPAVSPELAAVVARMMAKESAARFPSAADVAAALERFVSGTVPVPAGRRRSVPGWAIAAGLLFALVGLSAAGVVFKIQRDNEQITITTDDPAIEVVMKRNGELVRIVDTKANNSWDLDTRKMRLQADGGELTVDLPGRDQLVLRRDGRAVVTVRREPVDVVVKATPGEGRLPLKPGAVFVFRGHSDGLLALAVSPDDLLARFVPTLTAGQQKAWKEAVGEPSEAARQPTRAGGFLPTFGFGFASPATRLSWQVSLLTNEKALAELTVEKPAREALAAGWKAIQDTAGPGGRDRTAVAGRGPIRVTITREAATLAGQVLTEPQVKRLEQVRFRLSGTAVSTNVGPAFAPATPRRVSAGLLAQLAPTPAQAARIDALLAEAAKQTRALGAVPFRIQLPDDSPAVRPESAEVTKARLEYLRKANEIEQKALTAIVATFDVGQAAVWKEMSGDAIDLTKVTAVAPTRAPRVGLRGREASIATTFATEAVVRSRSGEYAAALAAQDAALRLVPTNAGVLQQKAALLATCPSEWVRDGKQAVELMKKVMAEVKEPGYPQYQILAAAYAEVGQFDEAVKAQEKAIALLPQPPEATDVPAGAAGRANFAGQRKAQHEARLKLYQAKKPYRAQSPTAKGSTPTTGSER